MSRKSVYYPHNYSFFVILFFVLVTIAALVFFGFIGFAFAGVGFSPFTVILILTATLFGSFINIPITKLKTKVPMVREESVSFLGFTYKIPKVEYGYAFTVVAVNVGGALIPTAVSIYLLVKAPVNTMIYSLIGILIVTLVTRLIAKPVKGVGIVTPAFVPPIAAAVTAIILAPSSPVVIAYVSGVLGTLIGADLLNLNRITKLGAPVASIGGAGTFDGVFLSGIFAVIIATL